jgi:hypothetical protein
MYISAKIFDLNNNIKRYLYRVCEYRIYKINATHWQFHSVSSMPFPRYLVCMAFIIAVYNGTVRK